MKYLQPSFSMPQAKPDPAMCCEACVFGRGEHAAWCSRRGSRAELAFHLAQYAKGVCFPATVLDIDHDLHRMDDDGCPNAA